MTRYRPARSIQTRKEPKIRRDHRVSSIELSIVTEINPEGYRKALGFSVADNESEVN